MGAVPVLVAALLAVAVAACADGAADPGSARSSRRAEIVPASTSPLRIKGTGFAPRERVRVTVTPSAGEARSRHVRAGRHGGFVVAFPHVDADGGLEAVAAGSAGGHASFQYSTGIGP
jgi:hypothetical protein